MMHRTGRLSLLSAGVAALLVTPLPTGPAANGAIPASAEVRIAADPDLSSLARRLRPSAPARTRAAAMREITSVTDPRHYPALVEQLGPISPEVRSALTDHFAASGPEGHRTLLILALAADDEAWRTQTRHRLASLHRDRRQHGLTPIADARLQALLIQALNEAPPEIGNRAAAIVADLELTDFMPLLLSLQFGSVRTFAARCEFCNISGGIQVGSDQEGEFARFFPSVTGIHSRVRVRGVLGGNEVLLVDIRRRGRIIPTLSGTPAPHRRAAMGEALLQLAADALETRIDPPATTPQEWHNWYQRQILPALMERDRRLALRGSVEERIERAYRDFEEDR